MMPLGPIGRMERTSSMTLSSGVGLLSVVEMDIL